MLLLVAMDPAYSGSSNTVTEDTLPVMVSTAASRGWEIDNKDVLFEVPLPPPLPLTGAGAGDSCTILAGGTS